MTTHPSDARLVGYPEALRVWIRVACLSFGGPAGQIAVMHRILVEEKRWIGEERFLHALNYCMLLPGPEAQQLATYIGWLLHGYRGGLTAGILFILPGFVSILLLSVVYAEFQGLELVAGLFFGLKAAVLAIVVQAALRIGRRALRNPAMVAVAGLAFVAIFFLDLPFPVIVLAAALIGLVGGRLAPARFSDWKGHGAGPTSSDGPPEARLRETPPPSWAHSLGVLAVCGTLWGAPVLLGGILLGWDAVLVREAVFFSKAAVVTFGGAYAVLAYVAQAAVEVYGWLEPGEMLDGLGMAETTPGPLIQVVQFVGFMGAWRQPEPLHPLVAGLLGSLVTTWVTFVPCFLWIFLGAPWIEALRGNRQLTSALATITAAVVGVILNLALWFALHTVFGVVREEVHAGVRLYVPELTSLRPAALALTLAALVATFRFRVGVLPLLASCAAIGVLYTTLLAG